MCGRMDTLDSEGAHVELRPVVAFAMAARDSTSARASCKGHHASTVMGTCQAVAGSVEAAASPQLSVSGSR